MRWGTGRYLTILKLVGIKSNGEFEGVGLRSQQDPQSELRSPSIGKKEGNEGNAREVSRGCGSGVGRLDRSCKGRRELQKVEKLRPRCIQSWGCAGAESPEIPLTLLEIRLG